MANIVIYISVFWSLNEKTAYRRNRVVQTRMNMLMMDITFQRESLRRSIRYNAHKFRQKNNRYYNHPLGVSEEAQKTAVNIAPPNWKPPDENQPITTAYGDDRSDSNVEHDGGCDHSIMSPRKQGIITRSKKPKVTFAIDKEVHNIHNEAAEHINESETVTRIINPNIRLVSAPHQYREVPKLQGQLTKRQQSAFQARRTHIDTAHDGFIDMSKMKSLSEQFEHDKNRRMNRPKLAQNDRLDNYFNKSKAAYQLRQDLRKKATIRKRGTHASVFTLQDALSLEKEKFLKSNGRVVDYIRRIEALKRTENNTVNK